ncbi:hypothetical protein OS493_012986 [Desmophyllum pertusum]|uniref:Uncharacterized protein n=1 Tax=Desmophyllum pertusum TaxID=174260 RepID=A0A9X0CT90_9CNID|nr:hypothetical protein OS493_012986 [Desmophyllum pertusum]
MAMKGVHVCLVVFVVIAVQMVYSCGPVASERRNELESNATSNISASSEDLLKPVDANDVFWLHSSTWKWAEKSDFSSQASKRTARP